MRARQFVTTVATTATLALTVLVPGSVLPGRASASELGVATSHEAGLLALTNEVRVSVGAPALSIDNALSSVARRWAQNMARKEAISHNPDLGTEIVGWSRLAENVGVGSSIDQVHAALLASPSHYGNLTDAGYSLVGIGVAADGGRLYVVEDFGKAAGGSRVSDFAASVPGSGSSPTVARPEAATTIPSAHPTMPDSGADTVAAPRPAAVPPASRLEVFLTAVRALEPSSPHRLVPKDFRSATSQ